MKVKLNDVIDRITGNVDRYNTELEYYVGGEHYECGRLAMYDKGLLDSEKGSTLGFKFHFPFQATDVLFMARNPHLKKAAMVMFDGICSDASYILRTKDESVLLQKYIPLIIQNDNFWAFFEANKSGSVNYLMNWKEMKEYEFELPDIERQKELVELVWGIEETIASYEKLLAKTDELVKSQFIEMFGDPETNPKKLPLSKIGDHVVDIHYGTSKPATSDGTIPYLRMNNMTASGRLDFSDLKYITLSGTELENCMVKRGDILFNRTNSKEWVGKTAMFDEDELMVIAGYIIRVRLDDQILPQFLVAYMNLPYMKKHLRSIAKCSVHQANINAAEFQNIEIYIPSIELQKKFIVIEQQSDKSKFELQKAIENLKLMQRTIIKENA